jgi:hypothetical protein
MDGAYLPTFAALAGSVIGGFTSFASAWLTQRYRDRAKPLSGETTRRQDLYNQFIEEAAVRLRVYCSSQVETYRLRSVREIEVYSPSSCIDCMKM